MGYGYNSASWLAFFSTAAGAAAALTGLIFVAVSINLQLIIANPQLVARAAKAIFTLTGVLLVSLVCVAPEQQTAAFGVEMVVLGALGWVATMWSSQASSWKNEYVSMRGKVLHFVLAQLAALPFVAAGALMLAHAPGSVQCLLAGTVFSFIAALLDAWVLLIEIHR